MLETNRETSVARISDDIVDAMVTRAERALWPKYGGPFGAVANLRRLIQEAFAAGLVGCRVVTPPEPDADQDPMGRAKHIWNTGDYSVTASEDRVAIKTGPDGLGEGIAFTAERARQVAAALIAAADRIDPADGSQLGGQHG